MPEPITEFNPICREPDCRGIDGGPYKNPSYAESDKEAHIEWHIGEGDEDVKVEVEKVKRV